MTPSTTGSRLAARALAPLAKLATIATLVGACSPAPTPVAQSSHDPSSPAAPEGVDPIVASTTRRGEATAENAGHERHDPIAKEAVVYACPMHPEVTSNAPGACSKCNMKLVPKK